MDFLDINRKTFRRLSNFCSAKLISLVLDGFGKDKIRINESNRGNDTWDVTSFVHNEDGLLLEKMKVLCAFDHLLGNILYRCHSFSHNIAFYYK